MTDREKSAYLEIANESRIMEDEINDAEQKLDEAIKKIGDTALRNEIDMLVGTLILKHEYKGYEIGRSEA